jgi:hypothetical protein
VASVDRAVLLIVMDSFDEASRALERQPRRRSIFQKEFRRIGGSGVGVIAFRGRFCLRELGKSRSADRVASIRRIVTLAASAK